MTKTTHIGLVRHNNYGSPYTYTVALRETKCYWVTDNGIKFKKQNGAPSGSGSWNQTYLQMDSIKLMSESYE